MSGRGTVVVLGIVLAMIMTGCGGVRGKNVVYKTDKRYPPYTGKVEVFWKEHGGPSRPYELIGTVSGMPFWAGVHEGKTFEPLHDYIRTTAGEMGGNGVIIYCGELGTVGQAQCYGDVINMK